MLGLLQPELELIERQAFGSTWQQIQGALGCSKGTIAKVRKRLNAATTDRPAADVSHNF